MNPRRVTKEIAQEWRHCGPGLLSHFGGCGVIEVEHEKASFADGTAEGSREHTVSPRLMKSAWSSMESNSTGPAGESAASGAW